MTNDRRIKAPTAASPPVLSLAGERRATKKGLMTFGRCENMAKERDRSRPVGGGWSLILPQDWREARRNEEQRRYDPALWATDWSRRPRSILLTGLRGKGQSLQ